MVLGSIGSKRPSKISLHHLTSGEFVMIPFEFQIRMFNALWEADERTVLAAFDHGFRSPFNTNARYLAKQSIWHLHSIAKGDGKVKRRRDSPLGNIHHSWC